MKARAIELRRVEQSPSRDEASAELLRHWDEARRQVDAELSAPTKERRQENDAARRVRFAHD